MSSYEKHFIPLGSDPDVFNQLMHSLGAPAYLSFRDVLTLDALPEDALAFVLIFPTTESYETRQATGTDASKVKGVIWFKQTINNACGLYSILHALCNGRARQLIEPQSVLSELIDPSLTAQDRWQLLENSTKLEEAYLAAALQGATAAPDDPTEEVDFHYICLVQSTEDGRLYELDGDRFGPLDRGLAKDFVGESVRVIREYMEYESLNFGLMALLRE